MVFGVILVSVSVGYASACLDHREVALGGDVLASLEHHVFEEMSKSAAVSRFVTKTDSILHGYGYCGWSFCFLSDNTYPVFENESSHRGLHVATVDVVSP